MSAIGETFEDRLKEILSYLEFLELIEEETRSGPPQLGSSGSVITVQQQKMLYSSVFLQLYNLIESTIDRCLDHVTGAALSSGCWSPGDLREELRREWVRVIARTHVDLNFDNRLKHALDLCSHFLDAAPLGGFKVEKGGGGNWNDVEIEAIVKRLGFRLFVSPAVYSGVKRRVRDDLGPLGLVVKRRNQLAHGDISFTECGESVTVGELRGLADTIIAYLREVVVAFDRYIQEYGYLVPDRRPELR